MTDPAMDFNRDEASVWHRAVCEWCGHERRQHGPGMKPEEGPYGGRCVAGPAGRQCRCLSFVNDPGIPAPADDGPLVSDALPVLSAHRWPDNAALIADVARLGYLDGVVLDATYGRGLWWTVFRPARLIGLDAAPAKARDVRGDFRALPFSDSSVDTVAYDPAYVSPGGRKTSTLADFNDRFGLLTTPKNPEENQAKMNAGLDECARVARRFVLMKCKDYVWSGRLFPGVWRSQSFGAYLGLELVDVFHHVGDPGPQPKDRTRADGAPVRQHHARQNLSVLLVFRVPRRRPVSVPSPQLSLEMP